MSSVKSDTVSTQLSRTIREDGEEGDESGRRQKDAPKMATTWGEMIKIWPYHSFLIIIMELFVTVTALNSVFNLYYQNVLGYTGNEIVTVLSIQGAVKGVLVLFNSCISDSYLGKFRAILYGTLIYIVGKSIVTALSFLPPGFPHPWFDFLGAFIVIIGVSLMGPSISPFAGDQFEPHQEKMISVFYSILYATFNIGGIVSNIMMPILRAIPCYGKDSCFPLSFCVSLTGVIVSFLFFLLGTKCYKKNPPIGNIFAAVRDIITKARINKKISEETKDNCLDYYFNTHKCGEDEKCLELKMKEADPAICQKEKFIADFKCVLRLLIVFIPLPMFWALYDQQYTVWMNQALLMECRIWGNFRILPDQMQVVNPVLIIMLIFLFQSCIYPGLERIVRLTPLRKMVAGGFIASIAFLISGMVQLKINPTLPDIPPAQHAFVSVVNTFNNTSCTMNITHLDTQQSRLVLANMSLINDKVREQSELFLVKMGENKWKVQWEGDASDCKKMPQQDLKFNVDKQMSIITIGPFGHFLTWADSDKPTGGTGQFKVAVVLAYGNGTNKGNLAFCRVGHECNQHAGTDFYAFLDKNGKMGHEQIPYGNGKGEATAYPYIEVRPGSWRLHYLHNNPETMMEEELRVEWVEGIEFDMEDQGGIYTIFVTGTEEAPMKTVHQVVPPNSVSILWQLPQIFIISVAEILVSITGLEFAYSQSGPSMKAVANAFWGFTVSLGQVIIIVVNELPFQDLAIKAFIFAGAMFVDVLLLAYLAIFNYKYREGTLAAHGRVTMNSDKSSKSEKSTSTSISSQIAHLYEGDANGINGNPID